MKAKEVVKGSTLLATIRSEFPKGTAEDLEQDLYDLMNKHTIGCMEGISDMMLDSYKSGFASALSSLQAAYDSIRNKEASDQVAEQLAE